MLAFHVAASLIAAFTAKDDCSWAQPRIFRSALHCDCAAGDLLKSGGRGHHLFTCFQQIAYIIVYVSRACATHSYCPRFCPFIHVFFLLGQKFLEVYAMQNTCCQRLFFPFFSWFASVFLICICFVKLQHWKLSWSPLGNGPGLAGMTTIEWISI